MALIRGQSSVTPQRMLGAKCFYISLKAPERLINFTFRNLPHFDFAAITQFLAAQRKSSKSNTQCATKCQNAKMPKVTIKSIRGFG